MSVLKIKREDGTWEAIGGGSGTGTGSGESEFFIVTVNVETMTASHSASEILAAANNGKVIFLTTGESFMILSGSSYSNDSTSAIFSGTLLTGNKVICTSAIVNEDKTCVPEFVEGHIAPTFTQSDYGKMLIATSEGLKWTTPVGGDVPSAEGVEF